MFDGVELAEHEHRVAEHEGEPSYELQRVDLDRFRSYIGKAAMRRKSWNTKLNIVDYII